MIYIETITDDLDTFRIERQKDTPNGEWYGMWIYKTMGAVQMADNDSYIKDLLITLDEVPASTMANMGVKNTEQNVKLIRKLVNKADKLGWFDHLK